VNRGRFYHRRALLDTATPSPTLNTLPDILHRLRARGLHRHLARLNRGLEKESLRVDENGALAQTPHPRALGSALAHPSITTDYSEALLEFITPTHTAIDALLRDLFDLHHFTYQNLAREKLWVNSMPCIVRGEEHIPIAHYGDSNIGRMKAIYRRGLRLRYGSLMQTIAGIHFNFSLPEEFWNEFAGDGDGDGDGDESTVRELKSVYYFALLRNFHRHSWLVCYLFGASPAVCKTFLQGRAHALDDLDSHSFYAPFATSLRLSNLGYTSDAQAGIDINYNSVDGFVASLRRAIQTPHAAYQKFGVKVAGEYRQLNANLLQIENEFYSVIRPKRVADSGESPTRALRRRGVQYVEVRSIDLNPFTPVGIDAECIRFLDMLLLFCLFSKSPDIGRAEWECAAENRRRVVMEGRRDDLRLCDATNSSAASLTDRARELLDAMQPLAELLDEVNADAAGAYQAALRAQAAKVADASRTPSAMILRRMLETGASFFEFALATAEQHEARFKRANMARAAADNLRDAAAQSRRRQRQIEAADSLDFDAFLADYFGRQNAD